MLHPFLREKAPSALLFDCEIARCMPSSQIKIPGFVPEFCEGWTDYEGMGISCIGVFDFLTQSSRVFTANRQRQADGSIKETNNFDAFYELAANREVIIGWGSKDFDDKLCQAHGIPIETHYDLLEQIRLSVGEPGSFTSGVSNRGYNLDAFAKANCGVGKSAEASLAPQFFQSNRMGELMDYCLNDVALALRLLEGRDALQDPLTGRILSLAAPPTFRHDYIPVEVGTLVLRANNSPVILMRTGAQSRAAFPDEVRTLAAELFRAADAAESDAALHATVMDTTDDVAFADGILAQHQARRNMGAWDYIGRYAATPPQGPIPYPKEEDGIALRVGEAGEFTTTPIAAPGAPAPGAFIDDADVVFGKWDENVNGH